jgi:ABC-type lipoprotein export system ATPase subunit
MPTLSKITKGFRRGELVVFTGPTGGGKTTLLSQLSIDFAKQNKPVLWGRYHRLLLHARPNPTTDTSSFAFIHFRHLAL